MTNNITNMSKNESFFQKKKKPNLENFVPPTLSQTECHCSFILIGFILLNQIIVE